MNIVVFDTETTSLEKPFCYNIGYIIADSETFTPLVKREFIVEQIWHNNELFSTAYYTSKRPIYVNAMRCKKIIMDKFGYITRQMTRDFKYFNVERAFAYNSGFDEKVFNFCCDWFKVINPFDDIPISDIRGYAHRFIVDNNYKEFCETNNLFTESGNYSTTAEALIRYITKNIGFNEEHTALADSEIELDILRECVMRGADINGNYIAQKSIPRKIKKKFTVKRGQVVIFETDCEGYTFYKPKDLVSLK